MAWRRLGVVVSALIEPSSRAEKMVPSGLLLCGGMEMVALKILVEMGMMIRG